MARRPRPKGSTEDNDAFLRRWSQRKAAAAKGELNESDKVEAPPRQPVAEPAPPPPPKTDADMPPVESIDESSDVSAFFSSGVSEQLRQIALRKLFHLPKFNVVDGLDDYADDFTDFAALGDVITADMRHRLELEEKRVLAGEENAAASDVEQTDGAGATEARAQEEDGTRPVETEGDGVEKVAADQATAEEDEDHDNG